MPERTSHSLVWLRLGRFCLACLVLSIRNSLVTIPASPLSDVHIAGPSEVFFLEGSEDDDSGGGGVLGPLAAGAGAVARRSVMSHGAVPLYFRSVI